MEKEVQVIVMGKVFKPNKGKVLALNKCLEEFLNSLTGISALIPHQRHFAQE